MAAFIAIVLLASCSAVQQREDALQPIDDVLVELRAYELLYLSEPPDIRTNLATWQHYHAEARQLFEEISISELIADLDTEASREARMYRDEVYLALNAYFDRLGAAIDAHRSGSETAEWVDGEFRAFASRLRSAELYRQRTIEAP